MYAEALRWILPVVYIIESPSKSPSKPISPIPISVSISSTARGAAPLAVPAFPYIAKDLPPPDGPKNRTQPLTPSINCLTVGLISLV